MIDSHWIFTIKFDGNNKARYKARLAVRGFKDQNQYDLTVTYAPVTSRADTPFVATLRVILNCDKPRIALF